MENRPTGRQKHVTEGGKGVHKQGEGLGGGPVGRADGYAGRKAQSGASGAGRGSSGGAGRQGRGSGSGGGKSPLGMIIALIVVLLGGGGGISALLGGGGSSDSSSSSSATYTYSTTGSGSSTGSSSAGSYSGGSSTGSSYGSSLAGGSSDYTYGYNFGNLFSGNYQSGGYTYEDYTQGSSTGSSYGSTGSGYGSTSSYGTSGSGYGSTGSTSSSAGSSGLGGFDLSGLESLFGGGVSSSAIGTSGSWTNAANVGVLNTSVAAGARDKFTKLKGNGSDTITLMVYMCGTDLESGSGMATSDLVEMTKATISDKVNILVYTGGCSRWQNQVISSKTNQIYQVKDGGLERLVSDDGDRAMTDPSTLTRFIEWCAKYYPASRNQLIFWDHGGGSASGYGYDQKHSRQGSMSLASIRKAIAAAGVKFDFIGFDTCLMATAENALGLADYADYMIASEETEPGVGWYYTNWLSQLSQNTSASTLSIGQKIIDDFTDVCAQKCRGQSTTLSLVDLAELEATLPERFRAFSQNTGEMIEEQSYNKIATARSQTREFAKSNGINQVDLTDLAYRVGTEEGNALAQALISAVKYNRTSRDMTNSFGLSIFFPNKNISKVSSMAQTYQEVGLDPECMVKFATVQASGQAVTGGSHSAFDSLSGNTSYESSLGSLIGSLLGGSSYGSSYGSSAGSSSYGSSYGSSSGSSSYGCSYGDSYGSYGSSSYEDYDSSSMLDIMSLLLGGGRSLGSDSTAAEGTDMSFVAQSGLTQEKLLSILEQNQFDTSALVWTDNSVNHTMHLSSEQWQQVQRLQMNMFYDDGEGYVDLGMDDTCSFTAEGDLVGETDRTWLSINGQPVAYYNIGTFQDGESTTTLGRVPCILNGETVNLMIVFDDEHPYGFIAGARADYREGETDTLAKAMTGVKDGDEIRFLCDYYSYDETFLDRYQLGDAMIVQGEPQISNTDIGEGRAVVTYCFTDLYGQEYWTPAILQ